VPSTESAGAELLGHGQSLGIAVEIVHAPRAERARCVHGVEGHASDPAEHEHVRARSLAQRGRHG
jgi:hypothetical protein